MSSDINNSSKITEKSTAEPIYDSNWCDMPDDIKLECIGKMELCERLSLRCSAKAERSLVDSQKIEFHEGVFLREYEDSSFLFSRNDKVVFWKRTKEINEAFELMKYIKKVGVFEHLKIFSRGVADCERFLADDGLFTAKKMNLVHCDIDSTIAVLRKMKNDVESIEMNGDEITSGKLAEILTISHIQNVPYWHIDCYEETDSLHKVAQMWIDKNSKIDSTFQISVNANGSFAEFLEHFKDRVVSQSDRKVRIHTNNPDRHILLERGLDEVVKIDYEIYRLMVISAEMKESEYDDNCKEWIYKMNPEIRLL